MTLSMKDKLQLSYWLKSKATYDEVINAFSPGIVHNIRFTEDARKAYIFLWTWSAPRFEGEAGRLQDIVYNKYGSKALDRRYKRIARIINKIDHWSIT